MESQPESSVQRKGPIMTWIESQDKELKQLFNTKFFGEDRRLRSAFKQGHYVVSVRVAQDMVKWWQSFGVTIRLHQIRPDVYGPGDNGPDGA